MLTAERQGDGRLGVAQQPRSREGRTGRLLKTYAPPILLVILAIGLWELLCRVLDVPDYLWPTPSLIVSSLVDNASQIGSDTWVTIREVIYGFLIAVAAGLGIGIALHLSGSSVAPCCRS